MPRPLALIAACLAALAAALPAPSAQARVPREFIGIVSEDAFAGDSDYRAQQMRAQAGLGIGLVRQVLYWGEIERARGQYDFSYYDGYVEALARHRMRLMPILGDPPAFRQSIPRRGRRRGVYPPRRYADMGAFAALLVRRYGPRGSFWSEHPDVPKVPIRSWQVWNEPNLPVYWASGPNPAQYTALLKVTSRAIRAEDPGAEIVSAGLPNSRLGIPFSKFLAGMYRAGARAAFSTLAIHPYARTHDGVVAAVAAARRMMNRQRHSRGSIWVTEVGWATDGPRSSFRVGERGQATRIRGTLLGLARERRRLRLRGVVYYAWKDSRVPEDRDYFGLHTGLIRRNGRRKLGYAAFRDAAAQLLR